MSPSITPGSDGAVHRRYTPVMAQRRFHYEQAFEHYLRANRVPYIAVDEAKKALVPSMARSKIESKGSEAVQAGSIKSFDFVVYAPHRERNLLVDIKGRMYGSRAAAGCLTNRRMESWVTLEDVSGLQRWQAMFGSGFEATFVFAYCLRQQPPDALFEELFTFGGKWYALREVPLDAYVKHMVPRSAKWGTVHLPKDAFHRISRSFSLRAGDDAAGRRSCSTPKLILC